jgi:hypothetical protein
MVGKTLMNFADGHIKMLGFPALCRKIKLKLGSCFFEEAQDSASL